MSSSTPSSVPASRQQPLQHHVQRVQHNAPTMRRQQQRATAPSNRATKQQKPVVKLVLGTPYQLPTAQLNLADSLRVLDLITAELAPHFSVVKSEQMNERRKRRRDGREEARHAKRQQQPQPAPEQPPPPPERQPEEQKQNERKALKEDIEQGQSTTTQTAGNGIGVTLGLNSVTRALEACQAAGEGVNSSPFAVLILTSCFPPALTAHFTYHSHYLNLPLLTLHPAITTRQLAHTLSPHLTSLLALAIHTPSTTTAASQAPTSGLLAHLLPMARTLRIDWLQAQGSVGYGALRVERVERSEARVRREEAKRRAREEAARAARPLSPKSIAAAVFRQKQKEKEAAEAAAVAAGAESGASPISTASSSAASTADAVVPC